MPSMWEVQMVSLTDPMSEEEAEELLAEMGFLKDA
jgi:hypothetical protein